MVSTATGNDTPVGIKRITINGGGSGNRLDARLATLSVILNGLGGDDSLSGGNQNDQLFGGLDNDFLIGGGTSVSGHGPDALQGDAGNDTYRTDAADTFVTDAGDIILAGLFSRFPSWIDQIERGRASSGLKSWVLSRKALAAGLRSNLEM